ncbi:hypothetical protein BS47DRAFT_1402934 [Hydnum rufescens UP504]|uniref:Uncharacterized protein n=1 Tax=Hydnum rufescens UP504 TaxID=1448309 RepID=A0A9P6DLW6_9AGAM|nr:hypothetical protein BS47DRAFT_1402934 [Hydnum rufescens UP504]
MGAISEDLSLLDCSILLSSDIDMSTLEALKSMYFAQGVIPHRESWFLLYPEKTGAVTPSGRAGAFCLGRSTLWSWDENAGRAPSVSPAIRDIVKHEDDNAKALETLSLKHATQRRCSWHQIRFWFAVTTPRWSNRSRIILSKICRPLVAPVKGLHELPTDQFNLNKEVEVDITLVPPVQGILEESQEYRVFLLTLINMPDGPPKQGTSRFPRHCLLKERSWRSHLRHSEANVDPPVRVICRRASWFLLHFEVSMNLSRHFGGRRMAASHPDRTEWSAKLVVVTPFGVQGLQFPTAFFGGALLPTLALMQRTGQTTRFSPRASKDNVNPDGSQIHETRSILAEICLSSQGLTEVASLIQALSNGFIFRVFGPVLHLPRLTNQMDPKDSSKDVNTTRPLAIQVEKMNTESGENTPMDSVSEAVATTPDTTSFRGSS